MRAKPEFFVRLKMSFEIVNPITYLITITSGAHQHQAKVAHFGLLSSPWHASNESTITSKKDLQV